MKYTLEITEKQAEIIKIALEEYFRLRMNQTWDFADNICFEDLKDIVHPLHFRGGKFREQTIEMRRAQDIWQVVRHRLWKDRHGDKNDWCVDARNPMCMTGEPLPKMERVEE